MRINAFNIKCLGLALGIIMATFGTRTEAATIKANTASFSDVALAVASANDGDTVLVPAGTFQWTNQLNITNAITLQGAGIGSTIIQDGILVSTGAVIAVLTGNNTNKSYRVTGIEIRPGSRTTVLYNGCIQISGLSTAVRIDNCKFYHPLNRGIYWWDAACGVVDHCVFEMNGTESIAVFHEKWASQTYSANQYYGDGSFATPTGLGTSNAVYIEDNYFTNTAHSAVIDSFAGARWVFRYNVISNDFICDHGTESSQRYRGTRSIEIYGNTLSDNSYWSFGIQLRSGTGVIFSNTIVGYDSGVAMENYRCTDPFIPWGGANGTNAWDNNDPKVYARGQHTGANGSTTLVVSNAGWTVNQWIGYTVINDATGGFGMCSTNSSDTIAFVTPVYAASTLIFNTGQNFEIHKVIAALDMPGMGQSDLINGDSPAPVAWPHQQIEPLYFWSNNIIHPVWGNGSPYGIIVPGVHFFDGTQKPGYTPFTYPHPLTRPSPPTNLRVLHY